MPTLLCGILGYLPGRTVQNRLALVTTMPVCVAWYLTVEVVFSTLRQVGCLRRMFQTLWHLHSSCRSLQSVIWCRPIV